MEDDRVPTVTATKGQIQDFVESVLWSDIKRELNAWKKGFDGEYDGMIENADEDNPSTAAVLLHMGDIHGRKKAVDYMLVLPDIFLQLLEEQKNDTRRKQT